MHWACVAARARHSFPSVCCRCAPVRAHASCVRRSFVNLTMQLELRPCGRRTRRAHIKGSISHLPTKSPSPPFPLMHAGCWSLHRPVEDLQKTPRNRRELAMASPCAGGAVQEARPLSVSWAPAAGSVACTGSVPRQPPPVATSGSTGIIASGSSPRVRADSRHGAARRAALGPRLGTPASSSSP